MPRSGSQNRNRYAGGWVWLCDGALAAVEAGAEDMAAAEAEATDAFDAAMPCGARLRAAPRSNKRGSSSSSSRNTGAVPGASLS